MIGTRRKPWQRLAACWAVFGGMLFVQSSRCVVLSAQTIQIQTVLATAAPSLDGGVEWLNVADRIQLTQLRGKIVILDFWTYCCINCLQTLPDLKRIEKAYPNEVVVIGVHAPKFLGERDSENVREAIERHEIEHPVVNDANTVIARKYAIEGWPSLRFIDPAGNLIATHFGEATFPVLDDFIKRAVAKYRREGVLDKSPFRFVTTKSAAPTSPLRFPGKVLADAERGLLFIADSGHHRIVVADTKGKLLATIGSGESGAKNGAWDTATFASPQGLALRDKTLYVADTENHMIRSIDLTAKKVTTLAGDGEQAPLAAVRGTTRPTAISLASPWDLALVGNNLYIAMAGTHQIWRYLLNENRLHVFAGNGVEDIVDGPPLPRVVGEVGFASFAQPSGLAFDGEVLYVADSEGSSLRAIPIQTRGGAVTTLIGNSQLPTSVNRLFTFGDQVGSTATAQLQHPLGVAVGGGQLYIADTYNNKIKAVDLARQTVRSLAGGPAGNSDSPPLFNEPAGLSLAGDVLYVADTNNHVIRTVDLTSGKVSTLEIQGLTPPPPVETPPPEIVGGERESFSTITTSVVDGKLLVKVAVKLPADCHVSPNVSAIFRVDMRDGDPLLKEAPQRHVIQVPESGQFQVELPISMAVGSAKLEIALAFFYCASDSLAFCRQSNVTWTGNVRLTKDSEPKPLVLEHVVRIP